MFQRDSLSAALVPSAQALSPAVAPRALWVASHHAALPRRLPGAWASLLEAIDALLQRGLTDQSSQVGPGTFLLNKSSL